MIGVLSLLLLSATHAARIDSVYGNNSELLSSIPYFLQEFKNEKVVDDVGSCVYMAAPELCYCRNIDFQPGYYYTSEALKARVTKAFDMMNVFRFSCFGTPAIYDLATRMMCTASLIRCSKQEAASNVKLREMPGVCLESCKDVSTAIAIDVNKVLSLGAAPMPLVGEFARTNCHIYAGDCSNKEIFRTNDNCQQLLPLKKIRGSVDQTVPAWSGVAACLKAAREKPCPTFDTRETLTCRNKAGDVIPASMKTNTTSVWFDASPRPGFGPLAFVNTNGLLLALEFYDVADGLWHYSYVENDPQDRAGFEESSINRFNFEQAKLSAKCDLFNENGVHERVTIQVLHQSGFSFDFIFLLSDKDTSDMFGAVFPRPAHAVKFSIRHDLKSEFGYKFKSPIYPYFDHGTKRWNDETRFHVGFRLHFQPYSGFIANVLNPGKNFFCDANLLCNMNIPIDLTDSVVDITNPLRLEVDGSFANSDALMEIDDFINFRRSVANRHCPNFRLGFNSRLFNSSLEIDPNIIVIVNRGDAEAEVKENNEQLKSSSSGLSGGAVAAIVIVLLILVSVGVGVGYFLHRRRNAFAAERERSGAR